MSLRVFFVASLLICGLSFSFMDLHAGSGFRYTFLPFLFFITSLICFLIALGWILWLTQQRRRNSFGGSDGASGAGDGTWSDSWGSDFGGSGDCGGGGDGGGGD